MTLAASSSGAGSASAYPYLQTGDHLLQHTSGIFERLTCPTAPPEQQFRRDAQRDLVGRLGAQVQPDGRMHARERLRRHPVAQEVAEDRADLAYTADHADITRRRIQRRAQNLLVGAMPACNDHDGGHGIGAALQQMLGHLADERLHALRQRRRAHELGAVVEQCHAPAQWDGEPRERLSDITGASHQQPWLWA